MIQSDHHHRFLLIHCLFIFLLINLTSAQICQNDIPDFFYNVSFTGPIFDQSVYTITVQNFSVLSPNDTTVFNFNVRPATIYSRPSFVSTSVTGRALNLTSGIITVVSTDPSFAVTTLSNGSYALVTNTFPLNYFSPYNRYLFNLIATQTYSNRPEVSSTAIVEINLENYNVHAPIFVPANQTFYISETAVIGSIFGTVYATDADNDGIIYSMVSSQFSIDSSTGVLTLQQSFQTSAASQYFVTVTASDDGSSCLPTRPLCPRFSTSTTITINVTAVNKRSPQFLNSICGSTLTFYESNVIGANITTITVFDDDRGDNGQVTISFPSEQAQTTVSGLRNTAYSQFYIQQLPQTNTTRTALLRTNISFDYDAPGCPRVWYLFILATDHGTPPRQSFCSLRINLLDLNDNPPVFVMTNWNYTIYRSTVGNSNNSARFLRIIASDADSGLNGQINYYIGTISVPYFTINQTTGTIILRSDVPGIYNLSVSQFPITFQVYAQDRGTPPRISEANATVTIYYNNGNDPPPARWLDPAYEELNFPIIEKYYETYGNQPIFNTSYGFNGTISYLLTSLTSSIMTVSSPFPNTYIPFSDVGVSRNGYTFNSGIVVTSGLHAEIQNLYLIYIRVLVTPPLIGSTTIRIIDQNDQIPTFDIRSIVLSVVENESGTRIIAQIQAFDRDVDFPYNYVQYRLNEVLTDTEAIGNFFVASNGSLWTNATFDRESNKTIYRIFVTAYDGAPAWNSVNPNTQDFQFDIQVIDVNDVPPVFVNSSSITIQINETTANGTGILNLTITDTDFDTIIDFGILSGNLRNVFEFNLLSNNLADSTRTQYQAIGQLSVVGPLSYERTPNYTLVLSAFDTLNLATVTVTVLLIPQNTKAPYFNLMPGFASYQYSVTEGTAVAILDGPVIRATDPDIPPTALVYSIVTYSNQQNLNPLYLNQANNATTIGIALPGLSRDLPFGAPIYNFSIRVTDQAGLGVSSYVPVSITVIDTNNNAPIPTNPPWILTEGVLNPSTTVIFTDYDDPAQNNTVPYQVQIVSPSSFSLSGPTLNYNGSYTLIYNGILNRTLARNLTVTFNASDNKGFSAITTIPIIVGDVLNAYPISDGYKTINIVYVNGYINSLRNVQLGSVYVMDLDDWFRASRTYSVRDVSNGQTFSASQGYLSTSDLLYPGSITVHVTVTKPNVPSTALGTMDLAITSVDSELVRQAATIRIQGEYPETLIDPSLGNRLGTLRNALASILLVTVDSVKILAIRSVYQYRSPYYPPLPFDQAKAQALTDVMFYVSSLNRYDIENTLNNNLAKFSSSYGITANASGPNPCTNYVCPLGTTCRPTRTIQPLPYAVDTNQTSFVGINVVDSADCVNATYATSFTNTQIGCTTYSFNNLTYCPCTSLQAYAPLGPYCQVLGRTFNNNGGSYAVYDGSSFSNEAPTRFSFDFASRSPLTDGLILLYGRNTTPVNDFAWTSIEIYQSKLRFRFRDTILDAASTTLNASTWYHVEYQYVDSLILVEVNDCQYVTKINNTLNTYDLSNVQLYLGGLPVTGSLVSALYPALQQVNTFSGCIRNVLSNGYYLDMNSALASANSDIGQCPCALTNSCTTTTLARASDIIIPWYTWLIIALVLLLLATIIALGLLTCIRRRQQQKTLAGLYPDDTRDNIIDYKETAGEEDHSTYNLGVLKKPVYALSDEEILANGARSGMHNIGYTETTITRRPGLGEYIDEKLTEQQIASYANDTQLHYRYEGEGSIASDLSSIESIHYQDEHDFRFLYSWGPKFSRLADLYAGGLDDDNNNIDNA
ncbi:unnamed protein product [Adineta steineri]|uniref:Cadherin-like protein n=1 Tax=Adineta steineri TaxID=433720 RepID=A0A819FQI0_9BILA|nr:unnamed protein product [Adineta steineri]